MYASTTLHLGFSADPRNLLMQMASTAMDTIDKTIEKTFPALGSLVEASAIRRTRKLMMDINSQSQRMPGICATSWEMGPAKVCSAAVEHTSSQTGHVEFLSGFHILSSSRQMLGGAPGLATKERHDGALSEQYTPTARPGVRRGYHGAVNQRDGNSTACRVQYAWGAESSEMDTRVGTGDIGCTKEAPRCLNESQITARGESFTPQWSRTTRTNPSRCE